MKKGKGSVLVCLDMEEDSQEFLRRSSGYAKRLGLPLCLLYVSSAAGTQNDGSVFTRLEELGETVMDGMDVKVVMRTGCVEDEILACAKEEAAELIILGHRHKAKRERVYVGSTVKTVISLAPEAVLVLAVNGEE